MIMISVLIKLKVLGPYEKQKKKRVLFPIFQGMIVACQIAESGARQKSRCRLRCHYLAAGEG
jgi:hypothetical protein